MSDPMTSPSQEVKPLPCPACGSSTAQRAIASPLWQIVCDMRYGGCGLSSRLADTREEAVRYWNRRRELESRVSPGAAPETDNEPPDESYGNQVGKYGFIRTIGGSYMLVDETEEGRPLARFVNQSAAEEVGRFMARLEAKALLAPSSAPEEATERCSNQCHAHFLPDAKPCTSKCHEGPCFAVNGDRLTKADDAYVTNLESELRASRSSGEGQPSTCDCKTLRERLAELRGELKSVGALFGVEPCDEDRPHTWVDGNGDGSHTLAEALGPIAKNWRGSGEDQTAAATDGPYCPGCGLLLDWIDRNDGEHKAGCKGASLSPQPAPPGESGIMHSLPASERNAYEKVVAGLPSSAPQPAEPTGATADDLLDWLDAKVVGIDSTESVTLSAVFHEAEGLRQRLIHLYLGESVLAAGVGSDLRGAIADALGNESASDSPRNDLNDAFGRGEEIDR